jgi:hypothetical protein
MHIESVEGATTGGKKRAALQHTDTIFNSEQAAETHDVILATNNLPLTLQGLPGGAA